MPSIQSLRVKTACGCCGVKVGSQVLAWLEIMYGIIKILDCILYDPEETGEFDENTGASERLNYYHGATRTPLVAIPGALITIGVAASLLIGIEKEKPVLLIPYLIMQGIVSAILGIFVVVLLGMMMFVKGSIFVIVLLVLLMAALQFYFWLWVYSEYLELSEGGAKYTSGGSNCGSGLAPV